jgi:hypothetical protein
MHNSSHNSASVRENNQPSTTTTLFALKSLARSALMISAMCLDVSGSGAARSALNKLLGSAWYALVAR